jgi:hypothetical protein
MPRRRWSELSERTRRLLIFGAAFEGVLKILALIDIRRRSSDGIRGSKVKWAAAVALVNSVGAVPIAYFLYGRRADPQRSRRH